MPEMRLLFAVLALLAACRTEVAQNAPAPPSPLVFSGEFLRDVRMQDIEALSAAIRLEIEGDAAAVKRGEGLPALIRATERALQADRNNIGWVYGGRLLALLRGTKWTPAVDLAISLTFDLDRGVIPPGGFLHARLARIFTMREPVPAQVMFAIADHSGNTVWQGTPSRLPPEDPIDIPLPVRSLPEGSYTVTYSLLAGGVSPLVKGTRAFRIDGSWRRIEIELSQTAQSIALKGLPQGNIRFVSAYQFVQWVSRAMALRAAGEPVGGASEPHPAVESWASRKTPRFWSDPLSAADVGRARSYARQLLTGADTLTGAEDLRLAYVSAADQSVRTFRLFLPSSLPPRDPVPLVVVLHGFAGDESSWLDTLPGAGEILRRLARDRKFAVLAPSARSRYSRFDGPDAADLAQLRDLAAKMRPIDAARTAVIGHGPAAFAAIDMALRSAQDWPAAVGVAGLPKALPVAKPGAVPRLLFEYAASDTLFPASEARKWAYLLSKRIPGFAGRELPGVDNAHAAAASLEDAIAFILEPAGPARPEAGKK